MRIATATVIGLAILLNLYHQSSIMGDEPQQESDDTGKSRRWNLAIKTAGGTQLWTDHVHRQKYRIQRNSLTGHWRLLDGDNVRQAWGTREQCQSALDDLVPATAVEAGPPKHVIVLLHGLMRTRHSMKPLATKLEADGYPDVLLFSYASSRSSIDQHAAALREVLEGLPGDTRFSFVGHSMGNIVVRRLVGDLQKNDANSLLDRCQSMVMLGPPNQGAAIARRLAPTGLYAIVTGKGGMELGPEWETFVGKLATPPFPFAIVAGDVSASPVQNPLVDGSSDFVVSIDEARLDGSELFKTVPVLHSFLMSDPAAMQITADFLSAHR